VKSLNKGVFFIILLALLGGILVAKSNFFSFNKHPKLIDRVPVSDYLIRLKSLQFSKEINPILFKYKLPIREFAAPDFLLGQAKHHGINLQTEVYLFFNEPRDEWGALMQVNDSSKLIGGIDRFRKNTELSDSSTDDIRIFYFNELNIYVAYEKNYLFFYSGKNFSSRLSEVSQSKTGGIRPEWKRFLSKKPFRKENLVIYTEGKGIQSWGFDFGLFAHDNDTTGLHLKCYLHSFAPHGIYSKPKSVGLPRSSQDVKAIELHLSPQFNTTKTGHELIGKIHKMGKKISFPTREFFATWAGDLSFREGGAVNATQRIITSEFDEDFNVREVIKFETIKVPGYTVVYNTSDDGKRFINQLFGKGLLRSETQRLRFLFSPLLSMKYTDPYYFFTSASTFPKQIPDPGNYVLWNYEGTPILLTLGTVKKHSIALEVDFAVKPVLKYIQRIKKTNSKK